MFKSADHSALVGLIEIAEGNFPKYQDRAEHPQREGHDILVTDTGRHQNGRHDEEESSKEWVGVEHGSSSRGDGLNDAQGFVKRQREVLDTSRRWLADCGECVNSSVLAKFGIEPRALVVLPAGKDYKPLNLNALLIPIPAQHRETVLDPVRESDLHESVAEFDQIHAVALSTCAAEPNGVASGAHSDSLYINEAKKALVAAWFCLQLPSSSPFELKLPLVRRVLAPIADAALQNAKIPCDRCLRAVMGNHVRGSHGR